MLKLIFLSATFFLFALTLLLPPSEAFAATLTVSKSGTAQFRRIQDAIDAATPEDAISVSAGIYNEHIDFKDGITLKGEGKELCRVEYDGLDTVLTAFNITNGTIDGFTFAYTGSSERNALWVVSSSLKLSNNVVRGAQLVGIEVRQSPNLSIENNLITSNRKSGIFMHSNSIAKIIGNEITNNGLSGIEIKNSEAVVENNLIASNQRSGIFINDKSKGRITRNRVVNNGLNGVNLKDNSNLEIINNAILKNAAVGVLVYNDSAPIVKNNIIAKNQKGISAGNVQDQISDGKPSVSFNDVWNNSVLNYEVLSKPVADISADPLFVNEVNGDYHLRPGSPAIGTGEDGEDMGAYPAKGKPAIPPWDVNADGIVDILDLVLVATKLGGNAKEADVNSDGTVDILDIVAVATRFGQKTAVASPRRTAQIDYLRYLPLLERIYDMLLSSTEKDPEFKAAREILSRLIEEGRRKIASLSDSTKLFANYPNPFNPETWIPFQLADEGKVEMRIYDSAGRLVKTIDVGTRPAGSYTSRGLAAYWDGKNESGETVASGMYFYEMQVEDGFRAVRRMVMVK